MIAAEILAQPLQLRRSGIAPFHVFAFTIQGDNMPRTEIVAVIGCPGISRSHSKIPDVPRRAPVALIFVVSWRRASAFLEASPGGTVTIGKLLVGPIGIGKIANGENRTRNFVDQLGGGLRSG